MKALRLPAPASPAAYWLRRRSPRLTSSVRVSPQRSRAAGGTARARGICSAGAPSPALPYVDVHGISQVPWRSILAPLPRSRTPAEPLRPRHLLVASVLPPPKEQRRLRRHKHIGATAGLQRLLPTLRELCCQAQARLASGWLAHLFRAGVEPAGSLRKVSDHLHGLPPFQVLPCRYLCGSVVNLPSTVVASWTNRGGTDS
jgi:hypothetical protein